MRSSTRKPPHTYIAKDLSIMIISYPYSIQTDFQTIIWLSNIFWLFISHFSPKSLLELSLNAVKYCYKSTVHAVHISNLSESAEKRETFYHISTSRKTSSFQTIAVVVKINFLQVSLNTDFFYESILPGNNRLCPYEFIQHFTKSVFLE